MFLFTAGNLLDSNAYALVNTVNCEGYMGKGIAYQFKQRYPVMNEEYEKICKNHQLTPGKLFCFDAGEKFIINFPTKNKWREKSKIEYISDGLDELVNVIKLNNISSIAIPPLGSGNGGLIWGDVKSVITEKLNSLSKCTDIYIYEPSKSYNSTPVAEPKLTLSALILMNIKFNLAEEVFNKISLQKTAYFMNILSHTDFFHFKKAQYGPFDHSIEIVSKNIKQYEEYHGVSSTDEAYNIAIKTIISKSLQDKLNFYIPFIKQAAAFSNQLKKPKEIEGAGTALYIIQQNQPIDLKDVVRVFKSWSEEKAEKFSEESIIKAISALECGGFIENTFYGFKVV